MDDLLTTPQAARQLGVSLARIRQYIAEGRLAAIKPGREYLITRSNLEGLERRPVGRPPRRSTPA